ncbi:MAG: hypothetical protein IKV55_06625 [Oscillospiraceae bacterium]|nr:hypothetical protein [Oscillospiraceae bacterium]
MTKQQPCADYSTQKKPRSSQLRRIYIARLVGRIAVLLVCAALALWRPQEFAVLEGWAFFKKFSLLHLLWIIWVVDMLYQLFPIRKRIPLGSQKVFGFRFVAIDQVEINTEKLKTYITNTTRAAYRVALIWVAFIGCIALLYFTGVVGKVGMFLITVGFYVCDLICVLVWCPFRLMLKNRCCTTCRIFNWDHLMMFSPVVFIGGFYSVSLVVMAVAAFLVWEAAVLLFPERFWEFSNDALKCVNCTDKLCTQYCQKLR